MIWLFAIFAMTSTRIRDTPSNFVDALASKALAMVVRAGDGAFASNNKARRRIPEPSNRPFAVASLRTTRCCAYPRMA